MKYRSLLALGLGACLLLGACHPSEPQPQEPEADPNWPVQIAVGGESLTFEEAPSSIVSLSPALTQLFYDLGEEAALSGVSAYDDAPDKTDCGTAQALDLAAVKALSPQLLLTDTPLLAQDQTALWQMGVEVLRLDRPQSVQEIEDRGALILTLLHGREEGAALEESYRQSWQEAWKPLEDAGIAVPDGDKKSALLLGAVDLAATGDCWEGQLLETLGLINLAAEGENWQIPTVQTDEEGVQHFFYGEEELDSWDPELIFYDSRLSPEEITADPRYAQSSAVAQEALYPVDWRVLQCQDSRLPEELGQLVEAAYPELWDMIQAAAQEAAAQAAEEAAQQAETPAAED